MKAREDLLRGHDAEPGGGQLDGQRQPIDPVANLGDGRVGLLRGHELGLPLPRPLDEQAVGVLMSQRLQPPDSLPLNAQRLAAGGHDPDVRARLEQGRRQLGRLIDHVLAVVEHEEQVAVDEVAAQRFERSRTD